ncbi:DNA starvation/stationary phase protection protein [Hymenobacter lutimineralis]|uniref:DNA starvation/stationary phase protection protein n=1 Tax=Hymenobacter lutimineralis TaxID=2606448 RepID=A0A5D6VG58_9BACT|nr:MULTISPECIES: DNA starvation/stationary phase protection protein [Hymenobacter]QIX60177.1 DNA starvation/stationary phase protection protein [Hymenobacter sp. BT18]TYZ14405.1 DNA starvation/stationary phase protection protein [Hymenobacter lutimineralis]
MATKTTAPKKPAAQQKAAAASSSANGQAAAPSVQPILNQQFNAPAPLQKYGTVSQRLPIGLDAKTRQESVDMLNQLLADTCSIRDMYKKHHWQVVGPTFYQLHLLYDKHYEEQDALIDMIAERIQILGGVAVAMAADVAELTTIPRPPKDREEAPVQVSRLLEAHQIILKNCHDYAKKADDAGDDGTNDLVVSNVLRTNELQVWFVSEHVVDTPLARS